MAPVGSNPRPLGLESSTLPLSHCALLFCYVVLSCCCYFWFYLVDVFLFRCCCCCCCCCCVDFWVGFFLSFEIILLRKRGVCLLNLLRLSDILWLLVFCVSSSRYHALVCSLCDCGVFPGHSNLLSKIGKINNDSDILSVSTFVCYHKALLSKSGSKLFDTLF